MNAYQWLALGLLAVVPVALALTALTYRLPRRTR